MQRILLTNTFAFEPMVGAITKIGPDAIYLIIDNKPKEKQLNTIKKLKNTFKHIKFKEIKTSVYEVYKIAKEIIIAIDTIYKEDNTSDIYIDITSGRKPKSIGIILGCYARINKVKEIMYFTQEINKLVILPKLSIEVDNKTKKLLKIINNKKITASSLAKSNSCKLKRTAIYNNVRNFKEKGFIFEDNNGFLCLTDYGKLVLL